MENRERRDPISMIRERLYSFTKSMNGNLVEQSGNYVIEAGNIRAEIDVDQDKMSFELYDGDKLIMQNDNADLETILQNIEGYALPDEGVVEVNKAA
ncbi:MAG: hypothetical protein UU40_C0004G0020 [Candidatus Uhrbacteria bacterium GW2011_GWD2_41_121]|uniref:Uncharacterized protein n=1 Tax=Candidatus Uhrbacteria bacterium GW2011_GWC1_41_20 TaxID=1618983 RepID=A0A0G0VFD8_9BACT|nr:MAG: hypothetical protein UT52_C0006G0020 [Candidatus Uhrbacteria bacterium GW2011_GWE1_39_46]KKR64230.1 MAG: hypothetical protein UU04_C0004G0020 [Candidatus Uhrbacteria bacterium GW2011_GWC2_40_450]KKR90363.1 MAG: hypothetical protein UU40_C0004G0020 [Candidatus Uhrbacteria bacterium GW2011_GWD2_41_121]KKR96266.1 MAG: hypothetical protein UU46_C0005G0020 [Candidatus Uhrbacteria bacterium GW2011_GWD1_41_16]KKR99639.1 MAG: hypothetical protein UU50_C0004G0020 [Candidatus Uhrbacteria bacteriu